jgi:uncharacterized BrkB/YihY/UPF0761 family membrane protein
MSYEVMSHYDIVCYYILILFMSMCYKLLHKKNEHWVASLIASMIHLIFTMVHSKLNQFGVQLGACTIQIPTCG